MHYDSISTLQKDDEGELRAFLAAHSYSTMYLRAELNDGADRANFAIARAHGKIVAAAAQGQGGMLMLQAPVGAGALASALLHRTRRRLAGIFGPVAQVHAARTELGLADIALLKNTDEDLLALALPDLRVPAILAGETVRCRVAGEADFALLLEWRAAFRQAALNDIPGEHLDRNSRADINKLLPAGNLFILENGGPLACCSFNARLPDTVQIGNVWTPPALRGKGYARAIVAGALAIAARAGVREAVLSTGRHNVAALAAYRSLGFERVGDYATVTISPLIALPDF
jgi:RimJ/RimL family protein N-acetyltransferase